MEFWWSLAADYLNSNCVSACVSRECERMRRRREGGILETMGFLLKFSEQSSSKLKVLITLLSVSSAETLTTNMF